MRQAYYITNKKNGFFHLITNSEVVDLTEARKVKESGLLHRVDAYIQQVEIGDGDRAYCPFVRMIAKTNGYHVRPFKTSDLRNSVALLEQSFKDISPAKTVLGQRPDPITTVAAFFEEGALGELFCIELEKVRNEARQHFLDQGLMVAHMHPFHELGSAKEGSSESAEKLYVAEIPLLMVRRMHKEDHVFMHTEAEKAAYAKYFGELEPPPSCPYHRK